MRQVAAPYAPIGVAHGATDQLGFHAVENRHCVNDIHANLLHQLGLDPRRLVVPGQKRLKSISARQLKKLSFG